MALTGVWAVPKPLCEVSDMADSGVPDGFGYPPSDDVSSGFSPARSRDVGSRPLLIILAVQRGRDWPGGGVVGGWVAQNRGCFGGGGGFQRLLSGFRRPNSSQHRRKSTS